MMPHLTRSAVHRCLQRHGVSRLPAVEGHKPKRRRFKRHLIGFFPVEPKIGAEQPIAEAQTAEDKLHLFVAIDRTSTCAVTQRIGKADRRTAWEFLEHLLQAAPYKIHTILTEPEVGARQPQRHQFAEPQPRNRNTAFSHQMRFDMICDDHRLQHRLANPNHP